MNLSVIVGALLLLPIYCFGLKYSFRTIEYDHNDESSRCSGLETCKLVTNMRKCTCREEYTAQLSKCTFSSSQINYNEKVAKQRKLVLTNSNHDNSSNDDCPSGFYCMPISLNCLFGDRCNYRSNGWCLPIN